MSQEKKNEVVEMSTTTNEEGLVEINNEEKMELEIESQLEEVPETMSPGAKEWMDRANRLYEQNTQMKRQLDYLQTNQDIQFINAMVAVYKLDDVNLKGLAKHHLKGMLSPTEQQDSK